MATREGELAPDKLFFHKFFKEKAVRDKNKKGPRKAKVQSQSLGGVRGSLEFLAELVL